MSDSKTELLPCPFCGDTPQELSFTEGSTYRWGIAGCPTCGCNVGEIRREYPDTGQWHKDGIEAWNTRSTEQQQSVVAELVEALTETSHEIKQLLHDGRQKIIDAGGDCDSVERMLLGNIAFNKAEALLAKVKGVKSE